MKPGQKWYITCSKLDNAVPRNRVTHVDVHSPQVRKTDTENQCRLQKGGVS